MEVDAATFFVVIIVDFDCIVGCVAFVVSTAAGFGGTVCMVTAEVVSGFTLVLNNGKVVGDDCIFWVVDFITSVFIVSFVDGIDVSWLAAAADSSSIPIVVDLTVFVVVSVIAAFSCATDDSNGTV